MSQKAYYAEWHYAECRYAECRYAECRYAECRSTLKDMTTCKDKTAYELQHGAAAFIRKALQSLMDQVA